MLPESPNQTKPDQKAQLAGGLPGGTAVLSPSHNPHPAWHSGPRGKGPRWLLAHCQASWKLAAPVASFRGDLSSPPWPQPCLVNCSQGCRRCGPPFPCVLWSARGSVWLSNGERGGVCAFKEYFLRIPSSILGARDANEKQTCVCARARSRERFLSN